MSVPGPESLRPSVRVRLVQVWREAGAVARVLIVAWALLPLVVTYGLVALPWHEEGAVFTEVDPSYVIATRGRAFDDQLKANVGTLGSLMEDCFSRRRSFAACDEPAEVPQARAGGIEFGAGPNMIDVSATRRTYALVGMSQTGARFKLSRDAAGDLRHTCPRRGRGGCSPRGDW